MSVLTKQRKYLAYKNPVLFSAIEHHHTHKNKRITFDKAKFLIDIYKDDSDYIVIKKATQCGATEWLVCRSIIAARDGRNVFYVLPTFDLRNRFVRERFDKTIDQTPYYKSLVSSRQDAYKAVSTSMSLKHIGDGGVNLVGSNTPAVFTEYAADDLIVDELDRCSAVNLAMAEERLSASKHKRMVKVSNPTFNSFGIDAEYENTDKKRWFIRCDCREWVQPDFFKHVVEKVNENDYVIIDPDYNGTDGRDARLICHKCGRALDRFAAGEWVAETESRHSGYQISKLFSTEVTITEIIERFNKGLADPTVLQRFYNGDIGEAYSASGARISREVLDAARRDYTMPDTCANPCVAGIDVGKVLHVCISEMLADNKLRLVFIGTADDLSDLKELATRYNIKAGCIDALPETRLSKKVVAALPRFFMVYYGGQIKKDSADIGHRILTVDRTASIDGVREALLTEEIELPSNVDKLPPLDKHGVCDYYVHMSNPVRIQNEKKRYEWKETSADHYLHAMTYMTLARRIALKM